MLTANRGVEYSSNGRMLISALVLAFLPAIAPTADDIIGRYIAARGGIEKMSAIRTIIYRGEYREGDHFSPHAAMSLMRPYLKLVGDAEHPNPDFAEGYDGSTWEYYGDPGIVVRTVGAASQAGRHAVYIDGSLAGYREHGWWVTVAGKETIGGREAWRLVITMSDGFVHDEFIDAATWLLIAVRKAAPIHAFGEKVSSEERIGDYREVEGVLFPFEHKEVETGTGRVLNEMHWKSITVNHELDPAVFSPPEWKRTALQLLLAQLFAERADLDAVMWSYRDFRAAHPNVDTDGAIQAVGYQILKMGDVHSAVTLLQHNAADYPRSASAAFGLGRAWRTANEIAKAEAEFRRALVLDPGYKRAADALKSLTAEK
jgi:hypothetical protein